MHPFFPSRIESKQERRVMSTAAIAAEAPLLRRLSVARARSDELFAIVRPEAFYDRPIAERHRIAFYKGHFEAFDWNLLGRRHFALDSFEPAFDQLFAFGIDPVDGGLPGDQPGDWPTRERIESYNGRVRTALDERLAAVFAFAAGCPRELAQLLQVAIEHRLMHLETFAYMLHQLPPDRKIGRPADPAAPSAPIVVPRMVEIPAGTATLGLPRVAESPFGWDNEFEELAVDVPAFRMDAFPVTNREYRDFLLAGGYRDRSLWKDEDWEWLQLSGTLHPAFWVSRGEQFSFRTMFGEIPLPLDWPVYVSQAEASAYARWAGKQLPGEAEWHRASYGTPEGVDRHFPWGNQQPDASRGNFDFARWDPTPVGSFPAGASAFGVIDLLGNGWEWTSTPFGPLPGFDPFPFYLGYSANFFDGQHYVVKGGSARTAACMLRRSFRNWFQPHYPYVYATFRCVEK
jgi:ergothioneine biosynthesis protein EgtB